ncbi:AAA family ATPase [Streptomyces sp. NPDC088725]|uniref:AAA family ATPase n=1 Tax=Streptomyces sp. NPDC088725 TaxID=3365873 RepID=UPI00380F0346
MGPVEELLDARSTQGPDLRRDEIPLLECGAEQTVLTRVLAGLREGRAAFVTVTGKPGHAQNALLGWASRLAEDSGLRVLRARATPAERALPHGVTAQLMTAFGGRDHGSLTSLTERRPASSQAGLGELLRSARALPTVVVIEDTQWLDSASLNWLHALVGRLTPGLPVAVLAGGSGAATEGVDGLCTAPSAVSPAALSAAVPPVAAASAGALVAPAATGASVVREHLAPRALTARGVAAVVELICSVPGDRRFTAAVVAATAGNPAVLCEVLRRFADDGNEPIATRLPELHAIAADVTGDHATRVLTGLPPRMTALLRALAVCGDLLSFSLVRTLAGHDGTPERELRALLEESGLTVSAGTKVRVRFPGVKARLLEDMPARERAGLYAGAAELARSAGAEADLEDTVRLLLRSGPIGAPWVIPTLREGFAAALRRDDHHRAHACLSRALREPLETRERALLTLELAAAEAAARPEAGDRRLGELVMSGSGVPTDLRVRAVDLGLARGDSDWGRCAAARTLPDAEPADRDALVALYWLADHDRDDTELMVTEVPELPDRPTSSAQAGVKAWYLATRGHDAGTTRLLARAALTGHGADTALVLPRLAACRALILTDDHEEAAAGLETLLTRARRDHLRAATARVLAARAELHLRAGRLDAAERDIAAAGRALPQSSWHPLLDPTLRALLILIALENGQDARARSLAAAPTPSGAQDGLAWASLLAARARVARADEQWADSLELSREAGRRLLRGQRCNPALLGWRPMAAESYDALGDRQEAVRLGTEELLLARRWGTASVLAVAELLAGLLGVPVTETAGGDPVTDVRGTAHALRDTPDRLAHAWRLFQLAAVRLDEGDLRTAGHLVAELSAYTATCPTSRLAERVRGLAQRLERPARTSFSARTREWAALSEAERDTAAFAGRGHANREIAELLSVSRRTVELRLSNTYRKLQISGRDELRVLMRTMEGRSTDAS